MERGNAKNIERKENSGGIMVEEVMRFMEVEKTEWYYLFNEFLRYISLL